MEMIENEKCDNNPGNSLHGEKSMVKKRRFSSGLYNWWIMKNIVKETFFSQRNAEKSIWRLVGRGGLLLKLKKQSWSSVKHE